jgi:lipopolysaccharide biosynthesis regulator YciM
LFQKEHDWLKAISVAQQLSVVAETSYCKRVAFFYCELATEEIAAGNLTAARSRLLQALKDCPASVRATIMLGDMVSAEGDTSQAIKLWEGIEVQDAQYLPLVAERLLKAYSSLDREAEGISLLRTYLVKYHSIDLLNVAFDGMLKYESPASAYQLVRDEMERNPTLLGLDKLLEARLLEVTMDRRADIEMVKDLVHKRTRNLAMYHCSNCGFKARKFYWHCPACQAWDSYAPRRDEESGKPL